MSPGTKVIIRGQSAAMRESFVTMGLGLVLAIVLVYLLMVANFQSWLEPFIIMMAIPGALAGVETAGEMPVGQLHRRPANLIAERTCLCHRRFQQ